MGTCSVLNGKTRRYQHFTTPTTFFPSEAIESVLTNVKRRCTLLNVYLYNDKLFHVFFCRLTCRLAAYFIILHARQVMAQLV